MERETNLNFIDFCSGIGAGRLALEKLGLKCVGHSEIDKKAENTYNLFFNETVPNFGDLMKIKAHKLPDFNLLIAGFPCQTFSVVGRMKGFDDDRGLIIYGLIKILRFKKPEYFILENVKGLVTFQNSQALKIILDNLDKAGYEVRWEVLNTLDFGIPQMRERVYIVGVRKDLAQKFFMFSFNKGERKPTDLDKYLINDDSKFIFDERNNNGSYDTFMRYLMNRYNKGKFNLDELISNEYLVLDTRQSDLRLYNNKVPTLRTGRHGILYVKNKKLWRLTGEEALLLQGFPRYLSRKAQHKVENTLLLSQAGNAMTVKVVQEIAKDLLTFN